MCREDCVQRKELNSNIAKLVEKRREARDNSQKGTGGNRGGTGGG